VQRTERSLLQSLRNVHSHELALKKSLSNKFAIPLA
jgi:hypothetical protein